MNAVIENEAMSRREFLHEQSPQGLLGPEGLLKRLFPQEQDRPSKRWLEMQCARGALPFIRVGRLIWFDEPEVRKALAERHTIRVRGRSRLRTLPA